jgi:hypothetical protein
MAERDGWMLAELADEPYAAVSETHSAVVFFAGDRAYKLKKPVSLGFLDFSTPEARAAACQRETELNRRFAPDVYLGVAEVRDPAGPVISEQGSRDALWRRREDNIEQIRPLQGEMLGGQTSMSCNGWRGGSWPGGRPCSMRGSAPAASWTGTGTCWPRTSPNRRGRPSHPGPSGGHWKRSARTSPSICGGRPVPTCSPTDR